jgi:hypothetical protein
MVISNKCFFCSALSTLGRRWQERPPYKLFLQVPWVNKQLASSDFTFRKRKKAAGVKYGEKMELGEHLDAFFHSQLLKIEVAMAF